MQHLLFFCFFCTCQLVLFCSLPAWPVITLVSFSLVTTFLSCHRVHFTLYYVHCTLTVWATCPALTSPKCFHQPQGFLQGLSAFLPTGFRRRSNENQLPLLLERAALDNGGKKKREKGKLEKCKNTRTLGSGIALMRNNCCLSEQQAGVSSR